MILLVILLSDQWYGSRPHISPTFAPPSMIKSAIKQRASFFQPFSVDLQTAIPFTYTEPSCLQMRPKQVQAIPIQRDCFTQIKFQGKQLILTLKGIWQRKQIGKDMFKHQLVLVGALIIASLQLIHLIMSIFITQSSQQVLLMLECLMS